MGFIPESHPECPCRSMDEIMGFKDYFSGHAADYAVYRPTYPAELFAWLAQQCADHERAWDCATGNGQAAIALADHFQDVIATDGSAAQLQQAPTHPHVRYRVALAESSGLPDRSLDLVTVAQAVHWFNLEAFYPEVQRVLKPGGIFAMWCYGRPRLPSTALDDLLEDYYTRVLDDFWTPERRLVETGYQTLPFPFAAINGPEFVMTTTWTLPEFIGYLNTWSATQRFMAAHRVNPLAALATQLADHWCDRHPDQPMALSWPMSLRVGRAPAAG
jgi:SAM-dependent methyltransferase